MGEKPPHFRTDRVYTLCLFGREIVAWGGVMSILKPRSLQRSGKPAELEGSIRELVRRQGNSIRHANHNSEEAVRELAALLIRVSGDATCEVDHLIGGLTHLRHRLDEEVAPSSRSCGVCVIESVRSAANEHRI
jgi:hypothetical protein